YNLGNGVDAEFRQPQRRAVRDCEPSMPGEPNHWQLLLGQCLNRTPSIPPGQSQVIALAGLIEPKHFANRLAAYPLDKVFSDQLKVAWTQPERLLTQLPGEDLFCAIVIADKML